MKFFTVSAVLAALLLISAVPTFAKADPAELYATAVMSADIPELEKLLAPNFWYIGANGHIRDKENFIKEIKDKTLVVDDLALFNQRETKVGDTRLLTANGAFRSKSPMPAPQGLMRFTMILANNHGQEQVALFQATPVIATPDCNDGNCKIK